MLRKFIALYKPFLRMFLLVLTSSITIGLIDLLIPNLTSNLINNGIASANMDIFFRIAVVMVVVYIIRTLLTYFVTLKGHMVGVSIEFNLRKNLFNKITSLPVKFFDNNPVGKLMSRITNDLGEISEVAHHGPEDLAMTLILSFGSAVLMLMMNVKLALVILIFIPIVVLINLFLKKPFFETNMDLKVKIADINSQANDTFSGIRQVKAFTNEEYELKKFNKNNDSFFNSKEAMYRVMAKYFSSLKAYFGALSLITILYGAYLVYQKEMNVGELTAFIMYVNLLQEPINKFANFITEFNKAATGFTRYLEVMDFKSQEDNKNAKDIAEVVGRIEFKNVWFKYEDSKDYILKDFNLTIQPGETLALVGESGAGKSTICNLINRYYEIEKGEILIDGINIRYFTIASLRHHIGLVSQDVFIFSGTLYDNIGYGDLEKNTEEVEAAIKAARLEEVVSDLPEGLSSYLGERGTKLSGGQKQRLSLARVFLKNPSIMILDEATSALDNNTEREIQGVVEKIAQNKTNIVVAHRLSTIINADKIVVVDNGQVIEIGTHAELLEKRGKYYQLQNAK